MSGSVSPFRPTGSVTLAAMSTSTNAILVGGGDTVVVTNTSGYLAYVRFGSDSSVTATASDFPILGGSRAILSINILIKYCAVLMPGGSGTVIVSRGDGSVM